MIETTLILTAALSAIMLLIAVNQIIMGYDDPPYNDDIEIPCRVCQGKDDTCPDCNGSGIETVRGLEKDEYISDQKLNHYELYRKP